MIESISIANTATFDVEPVTVNGLSKINYLFGSNGTGKTTVSRIIADDSIYPHCSIKWRNGTKLQSLVYNHDFVNLNFNQSSELKGVFTLGEKQVDTLAKIETAKADLDKLTAKIEKLNQALQGTDGNGGKKQDLANLEIELRDNCWKKKIEHDAKLRGGFEGYRNSTEKFKDKVLQEMVSNTASLITQSDIEDRAESVFDETPTVEEEVPTIDSHISKLITHEENPILKKRIIGREDVDIAEMIRKLENSDWVRAGREFYEVNNDTCPFCQQNTTEAFAKSLNDFFDETFLNDNIEVDKLATGFATDAAKLQQELDEILVAPSKFLDVEKFLLEKKVLDTKILLSLESLAKKKKEASQVIELDSLNNIGEVVSGLIDDANEQIAAHNKIVTNLTSERAKLSTQVWRFILEELKTDLATFRTKENDLNNAITAISDQLKIETSNKTKKVTEIRELEKQTTSVQPTIDGINQLLNSFGFQGFKLDIAYNGNSYKLVRSDGSDAKATLSEGEKTFITFLYFYYLLKGSVSNSGITMDKIVVFDDPISSLDSDILFIVSSLIKGLFDEVRTDVGQIKQIFVLTHNVYFHKEITYNHKRDNNTKLKEETFWMVRKPKLVSKIEEHSNNPIKTSYQLLWAEVQNQDRSNLVIQNTLRRILENYFKILGGIELNKLYEMFDGKEKLICKSLCSWAHDGSHFAHDDLYVSIDETMVTKYLEVFRGIFEKSDHLAHYKMMMGEETDRRQALDKN